MSLLESTRRLTFRALSVLLLVAAPRLHAQQTVTYVPDWNELWTNPGVPTRHYNQPVSLYPDATSGNCPRNEGYGMGLFKVRNGNMSVFQSHDFSQPSRLERFRPSCPGSVRNGDCAFRG